MDYLGVWVTWVVNQLLYMLGCVCGRGAGWREGGGVKSLTKRAVLCVCVPTRVVNKWSGHYPAPACITPPPPPPPCPLPPPPLSPLPCSLSVIETYEFQHDLLIYGLGTLYVYLPEFILLEKLKCVIKKSGSSAWIVMPLKKFNSNER